jgi:hypothetical protein
MTEAELLPMIITVLLAAGGSYVTIKVAVATLKSDALHDAEKQAELKAAFDELEKRVREIEVKDGKTEVYMKGVLASVDKLAEKIEEWNK